MKDIEGHVALALFALGFFLGALLVSTTRPPVDPDLRSIQQQRNAWAQYQEAGEANRP